MTIDDLARFLTAADPVDALAAWWSSLRSVAGSPLTLILIVWCRSRHPPVMSRWDVAAVGQGLCDTCVPSGIDRVRDLLPG